VERHLVSDWQTQVYELLADYEGITRERYAAGLASFRAWYAQNYPMIRMSPCSPMMKRATTGFT
jgi:hypothetical protein